MTKSLLSSWNRGILLLFILTVFSSSSYSQEQDSNKHKIVDPVDFVKPTSSIRVSLIAPTLTFQYEKPIGPKTVFDVNAGLLVSFGVSKLSVDIDQYRDLDVNARYFALMPLMSVGVKHFYNIENRLRKNKSIENNSANYFGGRLHGPIIGWIRDTKNINAEKSKRIQFSSRTAVGLVALWGMNRDLGNNFNFNLEVGPSLVYNLDSKIVPSFWLHVGFSKTF
ncbi:hypothetical protein [Sphingobacterium sp. NPDC055431]